MDEAPVTKRSDEPTIVSLESHRRKRLEDSRKQAAARARPPHERAINWRRAPVFLAAVALFMLVSWLLRYAGGLLHLSP